MDPITISALIGAGGQLFGGATNALSDVLTNRRSEAFSREMFDKTQAANLANWNRVNEYNSPQNQMARFQAAGLNPHLIYGQGSGGNAGAIPTPDVQSVQRRSPHFGDGIPGAGLTAMNAIYDLEIKKAQADNLKAQNTVIAEDALLKAAQRGALDAGKENTMFDLSFKSDLRDVNADYRREQLRQLTTYTDNSINENVRRNIQQGQSIKESVQRMRSSEQQRLESIERTKGYAVGRARNRAEIERINNEINRIKATIGVLNQTEVWYAFDNDLRRIGLNPNDPTYQRIAARMLTNAVQAPPSTFAPSPVADDIKQLVRGLFKGFK